MKNADKAVTTVLGSMSHTGMGVTDAHNHVWIENVPGADPSSPVLEDEENICQELRAYHDAGGNSLLDCQPGGCGRNGNVLVRLASSTGVNLIACTGFHRRKYYPPDYWLFSASESRIADHFIQELEECLMECRDQQVPVRAGFIKIALEANWKDIPGAALEAAAEAARRTGALIEIHTEKGLLAEKAVVYFEDHNISAKQVVFCHIDKRPDIGLHSELARYGVLLEYDTFYRPKYDPEKNLWPLVQEMVKTGLGDRIAFATDMAEQEMYKTIGNGPGLASLPGEIRRRLDRLNIDKQTIPDLIGGNIARRLAGNP